ncbi:hypothetical protein PQR75_30585 [Paraburkholderia fungorum]|uniref:hypothetical protein n=1 Tax=Paraburkholderia fungorum TaxID=134537 RepID=UPI0038B9D497
MPVELPVSRPESERPTPPNLTLWLALFIAFMLTGVAATLLTWPKAEPTGTPWFWIQLLALPALAWCVAFGLRRHYYDEETERFCADDEVCRADRAEAIQFASEPLAVVAHAYLCEPGHTGLASRIVKGPPMLDSRLPRSGGESVRHTSLSAIDDADHLERFRSCFFELLNLIDDQLFNLPSSVPLDVYLQPPPNVDRKHLLAMWLACWEAFGHRPAEVSWLPAGSGLMALDAWLDTTGGPALEKFALFVAVQLHERPPENSAEAAVALLLGWAPLAERAGIKPTALLHRPVEAQSNALADATEHALLWGRATPQQINTIWQAALRSHDKSALIQSASNLGLPASKTDGFSGIHSIDTALGDAGVAAPWLVAALAIEHAAHTGEPQLMANLDGALQLAVAQPAKRESNGKVTGN